MRLSKRIPCFLMPPLCAAVYLLLDRTGLFFRIYIALFGWDEIGPSLSILCFPILAFLCGILPAILLTGREHSVWTAWAALFFAGFFAYEFLGHNGSLRPSFPPYPVVDRLRRPGDPDETTEPQKRFFLYPLANHAG